MVVAIIGLLVGGAIYYMKDNLGIAQDTRVKSDLKAIDISLMSYRGSNGFYPTTEQGLKALVVKPTTEPIPRNWRPYMKEVPTDSYGQEYRYREPGTKNTDSYDLFSIGKDRKPDTADDIGNWRES